MTTAPATPRKRHFFVHGRAAPRAALRVSRWQKEEPTRNARWPASEVHRGGLEPKPGPLRRCVPLSTTSPGGIAAAFCQRQYLKPRKRRAAPPCLARDGIGSDDSSITVRSTGGGATSSFLCATSSLWSAHE